MRIVAFRQGRRVRPEEADELGHANNVVYLRWILDAATGHWDWLRARVDPSLVREVAWVVLRHEIDYLAPAFPGEEIEVHTWVPTCTLTTCERYATITRIADGAVLARSASSYCVIDATSGRPRRLSEDLRVAIGSPELVKRVRVERSFPLLPGEIVEA